MLTKNHDILAAEVKAHIDADAIIAGTYWEESDNAVGGKGCFIGCLAHSSDASVLGERFGLPIEVVKIAENIFENLPDDEGRAFFANIPDSVGGDGKDLSLVHWKFLSAELRSLPPMPSHIQDVIDPVIKGIDLLAGGGDWPTDAADAAADAADAAARAADAAARAADAAARAADAAYAAARAADAAYAADAADAAAYAADAAADAADAAADAADAAARSRQAALLLRLISEA